MTVLPTPTGQDPAAGGGQDPPGGGDPDPKTGQDPKDPKDPKPTGQDPEGGLTPEAKDAELARARREAAASRKELADAQAKVKEFEDAKLSDQQRTEKEKSEATERATKAESRLAELEVSHAVERAAAKAGVVDPEDASALIDRSILEKDNEGKAKPESVTAAIEDLKTRKPHLFRDGQPPAPRRPGSADQGPKPTTKDRETSIREAEGKGDHRTSIREKVAAAEEDRAAGIK